MFFLAHGVVVGVIVRHVTACVVICYCTCNCNCMCYCMTQCTCNRVNVVVQYDATLPEFNHVMLNHLYALSIKVTHPTL